MLSALTLVKVGWGYERLGAFAKPNILNIECMKKTEQCWSSTQSLWWGSWCRSWSRLIDAQCTSTAATTIYLLYACMLYEWFAVAYWLLCSSAHPLILRSCKNIMTVNTFCIGISWSYDQWCESNITAIKNSVTFKCQRENQMYTFLFFLKSIC